MGALAVRFEDLYVSPGAYLAAEGTQSIRHEYCAGYVRAMAGGTFDHGRIVTNLARHLGGQLLDGPCDVVIENTKVYIRTLAEEFYYYPDAVVDCSGVNGSSGFSPHPKVIFEVSSESTEQIDHLEKRANYCTLPSLQVYVLIRQGTPALVVYRRDGAEWRREFLGSLDSVLTLPEISCTLPLSEIYRRVRFDV